MNIFFQLVVLKLESEVVRFSIYEFASLDFLCAVFIQNSGFIVISSGKKLISNLTEI